MARWRDLDPLLYKCFCSIYRCHHDDSYSDLHARAPWPQASLVSADVALVNADVALLALAALVWISPRPSSLLSRIDILFENTRRLPGIKVAVASHTALYHTFTKAWSALSAPLVTSPIEALTKDRLLFVHLRQPAIGEGSSPRSCVRVVGCSHLGIHPPFA